VIRGKQILITGGLGFIFGHVAEYLAQSNKITIIDNLSDGSNPDLKLDAKIIIDNINNISKYSGDYDYVIHAAAESNVDKSLENQKVFLETNVHGTVAVLDYAVKHNIKFLNISTDEGYGPTQHYCSPLDKLNPTNPYSASKSSASHFAWAYHNTYNLHTKEIRLCNVIGKRQANTKLLPRLVERIQNNIPFPLYDGGRQTREYIDVRDVCKLIEKVLEYDKQEIFNLTFNQEMSTLEMIQKVETILDKKAILIPSTRKGHDLCYRMQPHSIIFNETGFKHDHYCVNDTIKWMAQE